MNTDLNTKLNLLIRSEKALFKIEIRKRARQTVFITIALLAVLITLIMLNVTVYLSLAAHYSTQLSAAILTGSNLGVAILFFIIATYQGTGSETESLQEIRDFAWDQVATELNGVKQQVSDFGDGVKRIKNGVDSVIDRDIFGLRSIIPLIQAFSTLKKKKNTKI